MTSRVTRHSLNILKYIFNSDLQRQYSMRIAMIPGYGRGIPLLITALNNGGFASD